MCKNLVKKFIKFVMMSLQTKNSIFLVCSDIIKNLNQHIFDIFSHNVDNPALKGLWKFQANKLVNARVTAVQFRKPPKNYIAVATMVGT